MEKHILLSVSPYVQKYYFNERYKNLPKDIQESLRAKICVIAEKTNVIISLGFYEDGEIFVEQRYEDLSYYDEIGAQLRIKKFQRDEEDLFGALKRWYMVYHTPKGEIIREVALYQQQNKNKEEIIAVIVEKHGEVFREFVTQLLS